MIYKRRHPEKTEYYRIIEANFEAFERNYPELFEEDYGYLRKDVMPAIYASTKKAHYEVFEFMALLAGHLPSPYETITFYYGIYSSSYRGKERKEKEGAARSAAAVQREPDGNGND